MRIKNLTLEKPNLIMSLKSAGLLNTVIPPAPVLEFGPCGRLSPDEVITRTIQDPGTHRLVWETPPKNTLVIKKIHDPSITLNFIELIMWLIETKEMKVYVEKSVIDEKVYGETVLKKYQQDNNLITFSETGSDIPRIDFVICLGGDGTLLHASMLFQTSVPPIMAFNLGSIGFLTPFNFDNFKEHIEDVLTGNSALQLRARLKCVLYKKPTIEVQQQKPSIIYMVLNDIVVDRGPTPFISNINMFFDNKYITNIQGDGLIVSTTTGSTAYAVAAGASILHPCISAIMITPICPSSLSFRPIIVPAGIEIQVALAEESKSTAWISLDGRKRRELMHGDWLNITTSIYPVPSISAHDQISDWFASLGECLQWNMRKKQKSFDELSIISDISEMTATKTDNSFLNFFDAFEENVDS